jgi:hypothetical protein
MPKFGFYLFPDAFYESPQAQDIHVLYGIIRVMAGSIERPFLCSWRNMDSLFMPFAIATLSSIANNYLAPPILRWSHQISLTSL